MLYEMINVWKYVKMFMLWRYLCCKIIICFL